MFDGTGLSTGSLTRAPATPYLGGRSAVIGNRPAEHLRHTGGTLACHPATCSPYDGLVSVGGHVPPWLESVPLASPWWVAGLAAVTLILIVACVRIRPRKWLLLMVPLTALGALLTATAWVNAYYFTYYRDVGHLIGVVHYPTADEDVLVAPRGSYPRGAVVTTRIPGTRSNVGDWKALVYLPTQWFTEPERRFPVIYLQHGVLDFPVPAVRSDAGPSTFFDPIPADEYAAAAADQGHPVVLVVPVIGPVQKDTECIDSPVGNWYTYLSQDVPAWVAQHPRLMTARKHTAIGGYSMGGFCAQMLALRNPEDYSISGNMSGYRAPTGRQGLKELYGSSNIDTVKALAAQYDSEMIIANEPASHSVTLYMEIGARDDPAMVAEQKDVARKARAHDMKVVSLIVPKQGHLFGLWIQAFDRWIPWTAARLYGETVPPEPH